MSTKKQTVVGSLQPRTKSTASPSTSSPSTRTPSKKRSLSTGSSSSSPTRSTRSRGQPTHYQALEGAPEWRQKAVVKREEVSESEDELILKPVRTPKKPAATPKKAVKPIKTPTQLPSPARSTTSTSTSSPSRNLESDSSSDDEQVEKMLTDSPKRKRAAASTSAAKQLLTPQTTPSKKRAASSLPKTSSPLKQSTTPSKRRASAVLTDSEEEDELADRQVRRPETPRKTPTKAKTLSSPTKVTPAKVTPTASRIPRSASSTPSRSSLRKQRLPPNLAEIKNAPKELRNRLVGFHMEDEGYGVNAGSGSASEEEEEEDAEIGDTEEREQRRREKGKGRAAEDAQMVDVQDGFMQVDAEVESADPFLDESAQRSPPQADYSLPTPPAIYSSNESTSSPLNSQYQSSFLRKHVERQLSVLTGASLPEARLPLDATVPSFDRSKGVLGYPFLEGGYSEWEKPLRGTLNEVVTRGMGNAIVLLGPRGVGKTMLIERTLRVMKFVHQDQHDFVTVRLSGLVHTTDRLALRSIAIQMREQGFKSAGEADQLEEGDFSSNSATMSTLLRLLEPSSSTAANTASQESSKPIILIVDEFDLFALHPRQSFLYCLLDIVQGNRRRGGVGVVGVSSRVDCLSLLEKRVRSRCQSHVLQMMLPSSFIDFTTLAQRLLSTDQKLWELVKGSQAGTWAKEWNVEVERFLADKKVKEYFEGVWRLGGNVPTELRSILTHFLSRLDHKLAHSRAELGSNGVPRLEISDLRPRETHLTRDVTLKSLSTVELAVLISCKHLSASTIDFQTGFNLEMAYDQYLQWTKSLEARGKRVGKGSMSRDAFCVAFDTLRRTELILPLSTTSTISPPSAAYLAPSRSIPFKMHRLVPREAEIKIEVQQRKDIDSELKKWGGA
ncbi:hypothetical protein JCM5350_000185 [Sporobolomyces pararoseus]